MNIVVSHQTMASTEETPVSCNIANTNGFEFLATLDKNSIDLILTDPPYIISRDSGMNKHYEAVKKNKEDDVKYVKSSVDWAKYKAENELTTNEGRDNYLKYGTVYGKKYCVKTKFDKWDEDFTIEELDKTVGHYYQKLRKGGTLILWFDIYKFETLKRIMEKHKFKQIRIIEWEKTNPQPRNSQVNYLTNAKEFAMSAVKVGKPTFNSSYDKGTYKYPFPGGKSRWHATQKSLPLFEELIRKHSNEGDTVLDTFLGSGTTAIACKNTKRHFKGCEASEEYYNKMMKTIDH